MANLSRNLDLCIAEDRKQLFERLTDAGTGLDLAALEYALTVLSDDWFELAAGLAVCSLKNKLQRYRGHPFVCMGIRHPKS